jgi:hypothetical protein
MVINEAAWASLFTTKATGYMDVDVTAISTSTTAANNAEIVFDTDFATNYNTTNDKWQTEADVLAVGGTSQTANDMSGDVDTILSRVVGTLAAGTHNAQTGDCYARLGAPAGASIAADLLVIDNFVDDLESRLSAARAGYLDNLNIGENVAGTSEITGLNDPTAATIADAVWDELATGHTDAGKAGEQLWTDIDAILTDTGEIGTAGDGLTNINLPDQTMNITGDITGNLSGSVGSLTGHTNQTANHTANIASILAGTVTNAQGADVATDVAAAIGTDSKCLISTDAQDLSATLDVNTKTITAGAVNAAAVATDAIDADALAAEAVTEIWAKAMVDLAAGSPSATASVLTAINYLYEVVRNKKMYDGSEDEIVVYKDDGSTKLFEIQCSDDGTDFTANEAAAAD